MIIWVNLIYKEFLLILYIHESQKYNQIEDS